MKSRNGIHWPVSMPEPDLVRIVRVTFPFSTTLSKNVMYGLRGRDKRAPNVNRIFLRADARERRRALSMLIRAADPKPWPQRKTYIDILVQKPEHTSDAINVLDLVCDAVKDAIGIDDRWFSLRRLEWEIVKDKPMVFVGLGQDGVDQMKVCGRCGRILTLDHFRPKASTSTSFSIRPSGRCSSHGTYCLDCKPRKAARG